MQLTPRTRARALATLCLGAAIALLATGGIHLEQYLAADFRVLPTIGSLFLLNFIAATVLGLYLLVPVRATAGRARRAADFGVAWSGFAVAAGSLIALLISERTPLFGFMEHGYRLEIVIAIGAETAAILALAAFTALAPAPEPRLPLQTMGVRHAPAAAVSERHNGTR